MGVQMTNQHLRVYVSNVAAAVGTADGGTDTNQVALAALTAGQISYYVADANGHYDYDMGENAIPASGIFRVGYADANGKIMLSPVIDMAYAEVKTKAAAQESVQVSTLSLPTFTVGDKIVVKTIVNNYGGFFGGCTQGQQAFYANHTVTNADAAVVCDKLVESMNKSLAKAPVSVAVASNVANDLVVTGKLQPYVKNKFEGAPITFYLELSQPSDEAVGSEDVAANPGRGNYKQVASREDFFAGYDTDYLNREADWPMSGNPTLMTDTFGSDRLFSTTSITLKNPYGAANEGSQRQVIELYFNSGAVS